MKNTSIKPVLVFVFLIAFASIVTAQMSEKGWKKTVTLSSGEVILDMSGEWDELGVGYGIFSRLEGSPEILTITQEGTTFTAVKQIGSRWVPKGAETIKGELDKDGFKAIYAYIGSPAMDGSFICHSYQNDSFPYVSKSSQEKSRASLALLIVPPLCLRIHVG